MNGFVYLVKDAAVGAVKIGFSIDANKRANGFKTANISATLIRALPGSREDEKLLHKHFADKHLVREWFRLTDEDVEQIDLVLTELRLMSAEHKQAYIQSAAPAIQVDESGVVERIDQTIKNSELFAAQWRKEMDENWEILADCKKMMAEIKAHLSQAQ